MKFSMLIPVCSLCSGLYTLILKLHTYTFCSPESSKNKLFLYVVFTFLRHQKDSSDSEAMKGWKAAHRRGRFFHLGRLWAFLPWAGWNVRNLEGVQNGKEACEECKGNHKSQCKQIYRLIEPYLGTVCSLRSHIGGKREWGWAFFRPTLKLLLLHFHTPMRRAAVAYLVSG